MLTVRLARNIAPEAPITCAACARSYFRNNINNGKYSVVEEHNNRKICIINTASIRCIRYFGIPEHNRNRYVADSVTTHRKYHFKLSRAAGVLQMVQVR